MAAAAAGCCVGLVASVPPGAGSRGGRPGGDAGAVAEPGLSFAGLLRQLRDEAELTREELAEAAELSPRSVSDLERGINRTARLDTARLLAGALGLGGPVRAAFVAAARGQASAADVLAARRAAAPGAFAAAATRALPRDIAAFTGRQAELADLVGALPGAAAAGGGVVGIHAIDGMAGVGKTTFAVHAAHRLTGTFPDGQFFLPLHAHTPGQRPVEPADALTSLLLTAGVPAAQIPPDLEARAARWRDAVAGKRVWLLLVTSRRRLAALEDATVISLDVLPPGEAAALLARLARRPGLRPGDAAVGEITRLCGYLPLAIGMVASQLRHHSAWPAAGLAADLAAASDRLALMRAENMTVAAAFALSYQDLTAGSQQLFRRLGLVPGPGIDNYAAAALGDTSLDTARRHLDELFDQHLLTEPSPGRYQLHDLLREHARALAAADDPADSDTAAGRLLDYYLHTAAAADRHFTTRGNPYRRPPPGRPPADAPDLSALGRASAWLEAERPNLHAAADYAADHACFRHAFALPAAMSGFLAAHGHWDQAPTLIKTALGAARQAGDRRGEADTLGGLGLLQRETGDYPAASASLARALALYEEAGDVLGQAYALRDLGVLQMLTGDYPAAAASHQQALALARGASDRFAEAAILVEWGLVQQLTGDYPAAAASQRQALALFADLGDRLGQADALNGLGWVQQETGDYPAAAASHQQALALYGDLGHLLGQAEAVNRLGELAIRTANIPEARGHHAQALAIARDLGAAPEEARALDGLGQACLQDGNPGQAAAHLRQALAIYQRIGAPAARRVQQILRN